MNFSDINVLNNLMNKLGNPLQVGVGGCRNMNGGGTTRVKTFAARYQCAICPYSTNYHSHMMRHNRIHTGEKPYSCPHCPHQSNTRCDLKKHIRTHTGEKPFCCPVCPYRSNQNGSLRSHLLTHS